MNHDEKYKIRNMNLKNIRNKNEVRVIAMLEDILDEYPDYSPETLDIEDIYALTLNQLHPRYIQAGSIVLHETVTDDEIRNAIRDSIERVQSQPNY